MLFKKDNHFMCLFLTFPLFTLRGTWAQNHQNQQITEVPQNISASTRYINLADNLLESIPDNAFSRYRRLNRLDLSFNRITFISDTAFTGTVISSLSINYNPLTAIPNLRYIGTTLTALFMRHCKIQAVSRTAFQGVTRLGTLFINNNEISQIDPDAFVNPAPPINSIELGYNRLRGLSPRIFANLNSLSQLTLQANDLQSFPDFSLLPSGNKLRFLYINNNKIGNLATNATSNLTSLVHLAMSSNRLTQWPNFQPQRATLTDLYLSGNRISTLSRDAFNGMKLRLLNMEKNGLSELPNLLPMRHSLHTLYLSRNNFHTTTGEQLLEFLRTMSNLTTVTLEDTGLETFPDVRLLGRSLEKVDLLNPNTMVCNCSLAWLKDASALALIRNLQNIHNSTTNMCAQPVTLRDKPWGTITRWDMCQRNESVRTTPVPIPSRITTTTPPSTKMSTRTSSFATTPGHTSDQPPTFSSNGGGSLNTDYMDNTSHTNTEPGVDIATPPPSGNVNMIAIIAGVLSGLLVLSLLIIMILVIRIKHSNTKAKEDTTVIVKEQSYESLQMKEKVQDGGKPEDSGYTHLPPRTAALPTIPNTGYHNAAQSGYHNAPHIKDKPSNSDDYVYDDGQTVDTYDVIPQDREYLDVYDEI